MRDATRYEDADLIDLETDGSFTIVPTLPEGHAAVLEHLRLPNQGQTGRSDDAGRSP